MRPLGPYEQGRSGGGGASAGPGDAPAPPCWGGSVAPSAPSAPSGRGRRPLVRRPRLRDFPLVRGERKSRFSPDLTKRAKPEGGDLRSSRAFEGADPPSEGPRASAEGAAPSSRGRRGRRGRHWPPSTPLPDIRLRYLGASENRFINNGIHQHHV